MIENYLLTGAYGFLGKYIQAYLVATGCDVVCLGKDQRNDVVCDLSIDLPKLLAPFDVVVHAAAKAHFEPKTTADTNVFFAVNFQGTKNLCVALEKSEKLPSAFVFISTVAVYGVEEGELIDEKHPLNGTSPYSKSKIEAENFLRNWCDRNNIKLSILRLPLIAGSNPPANLGAMIKGISTNRYFNIGKGNAKKSMVMASDVAKYIPTIAPIGGIYNLTDGYHPSFKELANLIAKQLGKKPPKSIPFWLAKTIALIENLIGNKAPINSDKLKKITGTLTFDDTLARKSFNWQPNNVLNTFTIK